MLLTETVGSDREETDIKPRPVRQTTSICLPAFNTAYCVSVMPTVRSKQKQHTVKTIFKIGFRRNDKRGPLPFSCCWGSRTNNSVSSLLLLCHSASGTLLRSLLTWNLIRKVWWTLGELLAAIKRLLLRIRCWRGKSTDLIKSLLCSQQHEPQQDYYGHCCCIYNPDMDCTINNPM